MDEDIKMNLKKLTEEAEVKLARSILKWKHRREGKHLPEENQLEHRSRELAAKAHKVITQGSKNIWDEFKKVYKKGSGEEEGSDQ